MLQARDSAGNNRTDSADRWGMGYSVQGSDIYEDMDLLPLGLGLYSTLITITTVGSGNALLEVYFKSKQACPYLKDWLRSIADLRL